MARLCSQSWGTMCLSSGLAGTTSTSLWYWCCTILALSIWACVLQMVDSWTKLHRLEYLSSNNWSQNCMCAARLQGDVVLCKEDANMLACAGSC